MNLTLNLSHPAVETNYVRSLADQVMREAMFLKVRSDRAEEVASRLEAEPLSIPTWDYEDIYLQSDDFEELAAYYLVLNSINYCYFHIGTVESNSNATGRFSGVRFTDGKLNGATLAASRLTTYWDALRDPLFLAEVEANFLGTELFAAPVPIPMSEDRAASLREVGRFLTDLKGQGQTLRMFIDSFDRDAYRVAQAIPQQMPGWHDPFLKRAQLFVGMLYGRCQTLEDCPFTVESLDKLTVFADYRLPQTLIAMGVLEPTSALSEALARHELIPANSRRELELRAGTIVGADELIRHLRYLRMNDEQVHALHIDYLLWRSSRLARKGDDLQHIFVNPIPEHHRTLTTHY